MSKGRVSRAWFGQLSDGREVEAITLVNSRGITARIITYGASLQALIAPDRDGVPADVTLGFATLDGYLAHPQYFGSTVGRVANRIAGGRFTLDGETYHLPVNNGANTLHGGTTGFDRVLWSVIDVTEQPVPSVTLRYISPHMDQGFPGELTVDAIYTLGDDNILSVEYRATTDRATVVNLSHHAYWNLAGEGANEGAMGHVLTIPADYYTPVDEGLIPTGELRPVDGTVFDFRTPTPIGARVRDASDRQIALGRGYDHNYVIARTSSTEPRLTARLHDPVSGRTLDILSNQPGVQFYSGNFFDGTAAGKSGKLYRQGDGVALEPQLFPDTPNRPEFGSARLNAGEVYRNIIQFRFGIAEAE